MPRVRRRETIHLDASPVAAAALVRAALALDEQLAGPLPTDPSATVQASLTAAPGGGTDLVLDAANEVRIPFFQWFFAPVFRHEMRRALAHAAACVAATERQEEPPPPPRRSPLSPPASFTPQQAALTATVSFAGLLTTFAASLFGQNADGVARTFDISNAGLGESLAITRGGALFALFAAALADRLGRRRILLFTVGGVCIANAVSAVAPGIEVFTASQLALRAFVNAAVVVGGIAVVEEAPEGARAFSIAMLGLASGAGFALSVLLLPLADLGAETWRIAFAVSAASIALLPVLARRLHETARYERLAARTTERGNFREVFDRKYGRRFVLLAGVGFLSNVFSAPSAQLTNRFLTNERGFSSSGIAAFRGITNGIPGVIGILLAGRLAETRGRRPVAIVGLFVGTSLTIVFFLGAGAVLWIASTFAIIAAASGTLAVGTMDAELFPTEVRGTSNALLLVCYVAGSAVGLLTAGALSRPLGGLGYAIALCGVAPLLASVLLLPRLPESRGRALDDVSPSEV